MSSPKSNGLTTRQSAAVGSQHAQPLFRRWFSYSYYLYWLLWLISVVDLVTSPSHRGLYREVGRLAGDWAMVALGISLLPGILRRWQLAPRWQALTMSWRKPMGITMFYWAATHFLWVRFLPVLLTAPAKLLWLNAGLLWGMGALIIASALWLTSSPRAQRFLGRQWKLLHNWTHVLVWLTAIHVWLFAGRSGWTVLIMMMAFGDICSWWAWWWRSQHRISNH